MEALRKNKITDTEIFYRAGNLKARANAITQGRGAVSGTRCAPKEDGFRRPLGIVIGRAKGKGSEEGLEIVDEEGHAGKA